METTKLADLQISRFILGSNPFSGFSHQSPETDRCMLDYYTCEQIKRTFRRAEELGVRTLIARADNHMIRVLREYWNEGGSLRWLAQTCPEVGSQEQCIARAAHAGASAIYLHGGHMDFLLAQDRADAEVPPLIDRIHEADLPAGIAGHNPDVFRWAVRNELPVDFYMCCHYNPNNRSENPEHDSEAREAYRDEDRDKMLAVIRDLPRPVIHYKILAAGRNDPAEAFHHTARHMRPHDAVCVGIYDEDNPDMLEEDVRLFEEALEIRTKNED